MPELHRRIAVQPPSTTTTYHDLFKLESPQNRAQVATDWLLGAFFRPAVAQIRGAVTDQE